MSLGCENCTKQLAVPEFSLFLRFLINEFMFLMFKDNEFF